MKSTKRQLLYITDLRKGTRESAVDYLFGKYLRNFMEVTRLYFSNDETDRTENTGTDITVPYTDRRKIYRRLDLSRFDFIIVRNRFDVLASLLKHKHGFRGKIGFQLTFPHSYRRKFQAQEEGRSVLRKSLEYALRHRRETRLIERCDFFFPISRAMKSDFYPALPTPTLPLPMGIDCEPSTGEIEKPIPTDEKVKRFVYLGTVDPLRKMDRTFEALVPLKEEAWILDIYTKDTQYTRSILPDPLRNKIRILDYVDRSILMKTLGSYHCGIFLLPENPLYNVASPTKVMDYYQAGIPALMSRIPECLELFDEEKGFFSPFETGRITDVFRSILSRSPADLRTMGLKGRKTLQKTRSYCLIAEELYDFMNHRTEQKVQ